ncbi:MAG: hypothetical protein V7719_17575 [Psychroserpens sp.]|uniref:hypothetical protein n=1 Tax=Psychroserpens sp. TaxID=2020870 RepID=UPI003001A2B4
MMRYFCFLLLFSVSLCAQNNSHWEKLIESAHNVGFCLYNTEEVFCNIHQAKYDDLQKNRTDEEEELHYFVMKEDWAEYRVTDWAQRQSLSKASLVLFFNVNQGFESDFGGIATRPSGFFVVSLGDTLNFKIKRSYKKQALSCSIFHKSKPNMLSNILWREFMSGRLGLIENKVEFLVYNNDNIKKKYKIFKKRFFKYQKRVRN